MQRFPSDEAMATLRRYGVEYVVLHQKFYDPTVYEAVIARLERRSDVRQIAVARWEGSETRLYQIAERPIREPDRR